MTGSLVFFSNGETKVPAAKQQPTTVGFAGVTPQWIFVEIFEVFAPLLTAKRVSMTPIGTFKMVPLAAVGNEESSDENDPVSHPYCGLSTTMIPLIKALFLGRGGIVPSNVYNC